MIQTSFHDQQVESLVASLNERLTPTTPVGDPAKLRGRDSEFKDCVHQLTFGSSQPFIYGVRGIGKTSLAKSSAQQVCKSDRDPIYVPCAPGMSFLELVREALIELSTLSMGMGLLPKGLKKIEATVSLTPALKYTWETANAAAPSVGTAAAAVRLIREFDKAIPQPRETIVIMDELENLGSGSEADLAYFIKQIGDQGVGIRFMYVGIARNIQEITGEHRSTPRYLHNVKLEPLTIQALIDIVKNAATAVDIVFPQELLIRTGMIANGYPHFSHLIALHVLTRCVQHDIKTVTPGIFAEGLTYAVHADLQQLSSTYEKAAYRQSKTCEHVLWVMADSELSDQNIDDIVDRYTILGRALKWDDEDKGVIKGALQKLRKDDHGEIIANTTRGKAGQGGKVYRYVRFTEPLMSAYVRLRAAKDGVILGQKNPVR